MIDESLVLAAIVAGDSEAFGHWVAGVERPLRVSLRTFAASVDTEAVVQEALLRVWQIAPRFTPDGRPNALLRLAVRVARNLALSEARRRRTVPMSALADPAWQENVDALTESLGASHDPALPDPLLRRALDTCRDKLPRKPAAALGARVASEGALPDAALAANLGMTPNTFLQNVTRGRRLLLECLQRLGVPLHEVWR